MRQLLRSPIMPPHRVLLFWMRVRHVMLCTPSIKSKFESCSQPTKKMGRWYHGTINGKWAFGILESSTPSRFHPDGTWKKCYNCPAGDEDNNDWVDFESEDDPRVLNVPEADWTDQQRTFMMAHAECFEQGKPMCGQEREDLIFYDFSHDEHYDNVVEELAMIAEELGARGLEYAKMDFNDLADASEGDTFGDDEETYEKFNIELPALLQQWPSRGNKQSYYIFDWAFPIYTASLPPGQFLPNDIPEMDIDRNITGNPLQPVCCQCRQLDTRNQFHKKKSICTEWEFEKVSSQYNPFSFQGPEWKPGKRFTTSGPYFCESCLPNWFWDEKLPKETRIYYWHRNCRNDFEHAIMTWSFGEQLRQALAYGDVFIESEC